MANPSNQAKVPKNGFVKFFDAVGPSGSNTFGGRGVSYSGAKVREVSVNAGAKPDPIVVRIRGEIVFVGEGDDPVFEITFSVPLYQFTNGSQDVMLDVFDGTGNIGSTWTKDRDWISFWNTGAQFLADGTGVSDAADHTLTYRGVVWTYELGETANGESAINVTGTSYDYRNFSKGGPT